MRNHDELIQGRYEGPKAAGPTTGRSAQGLRARRRRDDRRMRKPGAGGLVARIDRQPNRRTIQGSYDRR